MKHVINLNGIDANVTRNSIVFYVKKKKGLKILVGLKNNKFIISKR